MPWASPYLGEGFARDQVTFTRKAIRARRGEAVFDVAPEGMADPVHLSAITAHRIVAEIAIEMICAGAALTKREVGEVWQVSHRAEYRRQITALSNVGVTVELCGARQTDALQVWEFSYELAGGSFRGRMELGASFHATPRRLEADDYTALEDYLAHYYGHYGALANEARASSAVYAPRRHLLLWADDALLGEMSALATDMSSCLSTIYGEYLAGRRSALSVSAKVSRPPALPTMIRLDVVESPHGLKVVEVNAGNCGGMETLDRMHTFLQPRRFPCGVATSALTTGVVRALGLTPSTRLALVYMDEQSRFLSQARKAILEREVPGVRIVCLPLAEFLEVAAGFDVVFRDILWEELRDGGDIGRRGEAWFLTRDDVRIFPSLGDEILSDKAFIADIDSEVRAGGFAAFSPAQRRAWHRWMAPSMSVDATTYGRPIDFDAPDGVVVKPADGFGGESVQMLPFPCVPMNQSFYGARRWVVQRFYRASEVSLNGRERPAHRVVYGAFLIGDGAALNHDGVFVRVSPDLVVNIKHDGDVALLVPRGWRA